MARGVADAMAQANEELAGLNALGAKTDARFGAWLDNLDRDSRRVLFAISMVLWMAFLLMVVEVLQLMRTTPAAPAAAVVERPPEPHGGGGSSDASQKSGG